MVASPRDQIGRGYSEEDESFDYEPSESDDDNDMLHISVIGEEEWHHDRFGVNAYTHKIRVDGINEDMCFDDIINRVQIVLQTIIDQFTANIHNQDMVRIAIEGHGLREITLPFMRCDI